MHITAMETVCLDRSREDHFDTLAAFLFAFHTYLFVKSEEHDYTLAERERERGDQTGVKSDVGV